MNKEILREIGLTDYESRIYLVLLKNNQLSAYALAEKTGLYKQVTYDSLNRLMEKGFVSIVKESRTKLYRAIDPQFILEHLNEKTEKFKQILPNLKKIEKQSNELLSVETYKGENVVRISLRDIINQLKEKGGEVLCTAIDESVPFSENVSIAEQYERDLISYKIKEKVLIKEGNKGLFQKGTSTYRKIKDKYFNSNPVLIYGNNVQILIWGYPNHLIIIRSKEAAEAYRKQFELMWLSAKK